MKKYVFLFVLLMSISLLLADLVVDIPFELNIVGDSFAANGAYQYESEWINVTNNGSSTQDYTFMYTNGNVPTGWSMSVCDPDVCLMPNFPLPFALEAGETQQLHIQINVESTGGFAFTFTFAEGDLPEPLVYDFTFITEDGSDAEDNLLVAQSFLQNYPNPFNPTTTISFSTAELSENAELVIYNSKGQEIRNFAIQNNQFSIIWDGTDSKGQTVPSGIYLYKLISHNFVETKKMVLMK